MPERLLMWVNRLKEGGRRHPNWVTLAFFVGFVGLANWPLVMHLSTHVEGRPFDDVFGILWDLNWVQRAIFDLHASPFFMPDVFYPHGFYVASSSPPIWWFVVFAPATRLLGPVVTYNLVSLSAYVISGLGMVKLVTYLGQRTSAGVLAGCVYIAAPILTLRLGGHTDILLSSMWLPYLAWFSQRALQEQSRRNQLLAGVCLGLSCLGHWQFVFLAPLLPLSIIGFGRFQVGCAQVSWRQRLERLIVVGLSGALLAAPFAAITWAARSQMFVDSPVFAITTAADASLSPDRLVVPNPLNSLWRDWSRAMFPVNGESAAVSVGYTAIGLAALGLARRWPQRRAYGVALSLSIILAMGIILHWNTHPVVLTGSSPLISLTHPVVESLVGSDLMPASRNALVIPLPLAILYRLLPVMSFTRVWARYMIVGMVALGVFAGAGVDWLTVRFRKRSIGIILVMVGLVFIEGLTAPYAAFTEVSDNVRPIDRWLAAQPHMTLIEYPFTSLTSKLAMYRQSVHGQSIVNGYASIEPSHLQSATPILGTWPTAASIDLLRRWRVDYMLVNGTNEKGYLNEVLPSIQSITGLCMERDDNEPDRNRHTYLFRIMPEGQDCSAGPLEQDN